MAEPKWIKMDVYMFRHPKLLIIDSMEESNLIYYVWTSSILLAGECNMGGELYISENMPYSLKSLSIVLRRSEEEVKKAYDVLMSLGMIEMTEDNVYRIYNWEKHQNVESLDKIRKQNNERVARYRERKREEKRKADEENNVMDSNVTCEDGVTACNVTETEQNKKENKSIEREADRDRHNVSHSHHEKTSKDDSLKDHKNISSSSIELMEYCERITGIVSPLDIKALNVAVNIHGRDNVKKAIDKSIEAGRVAMPYINGILKNWRKEGYPEDESSEDYKFKSIKGRGKGGKCYGSNSNDKGDESNCKEFKVIKPEGPRLTDEEREKLCANLI